VTALRAATEALAGQNRVLERIATGADLSETLEEIVALVEARLPGALCSIMRLDRERRALTFVAGRSLPRPYGAALVDVAVGPAVGACGTAAHFAAAVVSEDIEADPRWNAFRELTRAHGLRSCWSLPIFGASGGAASPGERVLGTFAIYRRRPARPDAAAEEAMIAAAHLAGVALEREEAVAALRAGERRFRSVLDSTPQAVLVRDLGGRHLFANRQASSLFGVDPAAWVGRTAEELLPPDVAALLEERRRRVLVALTPQTSDESATLQDGARAELRIETFPLFREDGLPYGDCLVASDVTERRALEERLRRSQKLEAIGRLAGGVAHDFNNLLTVIVGCGERLLARCAADDPGRADLEAIRDAAERAGRLTTRLVAFGRREVVGPAVVDLRATTRAALDLLRRLVGPDVRIETRLDEPVGPVRIDPGQWDQALANLAVNARDAMRDGGALRLSLDETDVPPRPEDGPQAPRRWVRCVVSDDGCGMDDDVRARLFEPFFTTKGEGRGTGLGLATVYAVVQQAGGRIDVESAPGRGATFRILLPVATGAHAAASNGTAPPARGGGETVLLVEDDAGVRRFARKVLEDGGYAVLEAAGGAEAERFAAEHRGPIALLLTDVVMPDMDGRATADTVRSLRPDVRVVFMSGYSEDAVLRRGVASSTASFLPKPFTADRLLRLIRTVLDARVAAT
jgi:two-component system cell cycle sensor histidine kinase/response regulator CckA